VGKVSLKKYNRILGDLFTELLTAVFQSNYLQLPYLIQFKLFQGLCAISVVGQCTVKAMPNSAILIWIAAYALISFIHSWAWMLQLNPSFTWIRTMIWVHRGGKVTTFLIIGHYFQLPDFHFVLLNSWCHEGLEDFGALGPLCVCHVQVSLMVFNRITGHRSVVLHSASKCPRSPSYFHQYSRFFFFSALIPASHENCRENGAKYLVAIGGWNEGSEKYSAMACNDESRATFVKSVAAFSRNLQLDGFDLDWEFPGQRGGSYNDKYCFSSLIKDLRENLPEVGTSLILASCIKIY